MSYPPARGHPLNPNTVVDRDCLTAPLNGGPGCPAKPFPCGGYPVDSAFGVTFNAGQVFEVQFQNPGVPNPTDTSDQGRHNGGLCEFALSYNGGSTWTKIATYHRTCPDVFYRWPVKIPENAPTCDTLGQCILSWSWINALGNREFYQNCADVRIMGQSTTPLPIIDITKANLPEFGTTLTPEGDPANTGNARGSGPLAEDVTANLQPFAPGTTNTQPSPKKPSPSCEEGIIRCVRNNRSPYYIACHNGKKTTLKCKGRSENLKTFKNAAKVHKTKNDKPAVIVYDIVCRLVHQNPEILYFLQGDAKDNADIGTYIAVFVSNEGVALRRMESHSARSRAQTPVEVGDFNEEESMRYLGKLEEVANKFMDGQSFEEIYIDSFRKLFANEEEYIGVLKDTFGKTL
ncbi:10997_t:CDS:2, partial [Diversispora eburnea]